MRSFRKRVATLIVSLGLAVGLSTVLAPAAGAGMIELHWNISATAHIAKMGSDLNVTGGHFDGTINTDTGALNGRMSMPPTTLTVNLLGTIPAADITAQITPVGRTTGHVDFNTFNVTTKSSFNIRITKVVPHGTDQNLVGDSCKTETPITLKLSGVASLDKPSSLSSTFTIPDFADCNLFEVAINELIPGPGNTFTATFAPEGQSAPPPEPAPPAPAPAPEPAATVEGGLNIQVGPQVIETPPPPVLPLPALPAPSPAAPGAGLLPGLPLPPLFTVS